MGPRWVSWHLHKGVAQTLADALDGDLGIAVVVAVIVAHSHLGGTWFSERFKLQMLSKMINVLRSNIF